MNDVVSQCRPGSRLALVGIGGVGYVVTFFTISPAVAFMESEHDFVQDKIADCDTNSKSQIAIEFTYRVRQASPPTWIFWVNAKDVASIKASYREIAKAVQIPGCDERNFDALTLVRNWLDDESNGPWVMVIDSADDTSVLTDPFSNEPQASTNHDTSPLPQIREFLTISQNGSVLITSTNNEAAQLLTGNCAHHVEVEEMNEGEALALLKSKLHSKVIHTEDEAKDLVKAAEYMPLAISQTASHISMDYPKFNMAQAIEKLNNPDQDATRLLESSIHESNRDMRRSNSVVKSWHLNFQYVRDKHPSAARLLSLMCLFDRQDIPEALLVGQYGEEAVTVLVPAGPRQPWWKRLRRRRSKRNKRTTERRTTAKEKNSAFTEDWRVLNNLMLVKTSLNGLHFNMHRLVQHTTKRWLEINGEMNAWSTKFVSIMAICFPKHEYDNWKLCQYLFPHAQHVASYRPTDPAALKRWASLVHDIAQFAEFAGNFSPAERLGRAAMQASEDVMGECNDVTLQYVYDLGTKLSRLHRKEEAETLYRRAWEGRLALLGPDHTDTLESAHRLGGFLSMQNRWDEADAMTNRAIEGYERVYGPKHDKTEAFLVQLTFGYVMNERFEQAERLHRRVCEIQKEEFGEESVQNYSNMRRLASLLNMQHKAAEAEVLLLQVLQVEEAKHGLLHVETIQIINFLGEALTQQDKLEDAATYYRRVLDVFTDLGEKAREDALTSLNSLALVLSRQGHLEEAQTIAQRMIDEATKLLGADHVDTYAGYHTLAEVLTQREDFHEALAMYEKAYVGMCGRVGAEHADTMEYLNSLNAAKNRLLAWPRDADSSSIESEEVPKFVSSLSLVEAFQLPEAIMV